MWISSWKSISKVYTEISRGTCENAPKNIIKPFLGNADFVSFYSITVNYVGGEMYSIWFKLTGQAAITTRFTLIRYATKCNQILQCINARYQDQSRN